jgi:hypothetical protein
MLFTCHLFGCLIQLNANLIGLGIHDIHDSVNQKAVDDKAANVASPTLAPQLGSYEPSVTAIPTTTTHAPTVAPVP